MTCTFLAEIFLFLFKAQHVFLRQPDKFFSFLLRPSIDDRILDLLHLPHGPAGIRAAFLRQRQNFAAPFRMANRLYSMSLI